MTRPSTLQAGDTIAIVAPAKAIEPEHVVWAKNYLEQQGFKVLIGEHTLGRCNYFSGTELERSSDFQWAINHPEVKAILCARGGYGSVQILDRLQWAGMLREPKWIIGFSDVTFFHQHLSTLGIQSVHGTMPLNFSKNSEASLNTLVQAITQSPSPIEVSSTEFNKRGEAEGVLLGGNLSILYALLGTDAQPNYKGSILFIEDLAEHLYAIDRMFHAFRKAGILEQINGLIVGGMTNIKDTDAPFGKSLEELILSHFEYRKIPIAFNFPAGHIDDNRAIILGSEVQLNVSTDQSTLSYI